MKAYLVPKRNKFRGKQITTLPTVDNRDLCRLQAGELKLKTKNNLDHYRSIAEERSLLEKTIGEHPGGGRGV